VEAAMQIWHDFNKTKDQDLRNQIVLQYMGILEKIVRQMAKQYQDYLEYDDLKSYGMLGLMDAVERFDIRKGIRFETYASIRIRGAIIDQVRSQDWIPKNVRRRFRAIEDAEEELRNELDRMPTDDEVAAHLDIPAEYVNRTRRQWNAHTVFSLEDMPGSAVQVEEKDEQCLPEESIMKKEAVQALAAAIDELPERERLVVTLYFYEELNLKEIGKVLDVTESRVSQMRTRALARLRQTMAGR
jgi:RNA polymerase sigma factor for flagellar operon FliA